MANVSNGCEASVQAAIAPYQNPTTAQIAIINQNKLDYYKQIDQNNELANTALSAEAAYFISKYGKDIYKTLLDERAKYITPPVNITDFDNQGYSKVLEHINVLNQVITIDTPLYNVLDKYLPDHDSNTIYREIEYRDNEYAKLSKLNYYLNVFYYCLFIILILVLFSSDKIFLQERFMVYLFLAILPILYPWLFMLFRRIFVYIYPSYNGPINAFVDTNTGTTTMFSNNVSNSYKKKEDTTTV
jgi:hypothetical protein